MFGLISVLGLALAAAAPLPDITYPDEVSLISPAVKNALGSVLDEYDIDFSDSAFTLGSSMPFGGSFYVVESVAANVSGGGIGLVSAHVLRYYGSYTSQIHSVPPLPIAWQSYNPATNYYYVVEYNTGLFEGIDLGNLTHDDTAYSYYNDALEISHLLRASGAGPYGYYMDSANFDVFRNRFAAAVYRYFVTGSDAYDNGYAVGHSDGYASGRVVGYNEGLNATGDSALAGSLFGAIVAIPFDVLNGLNSLVIWGIPVISILISFLTIGLIVVVVKRFI